MTRDSITDPSHLEGSRQEAKQVEKKNEGNFQLENHNKNPRINNAV
jgi:hypothetical protein